MPSNYAASRSFTRTSLALALAAAATATAAARVALAEPEAPAAAAPATQPAKVEPVDFRKIKELLPETIGGLKRSAANGQRQAIGEMKISQADADFSEEGKEASAHVTVIDYGAMPGTAEAMAGWSQLEIDEETDNTYRKTYKISGYYALENYDKSNQSGELTMLVGNRFIVTLTINGLPGETLKQAGEAMKLKELEAVGK